MKQRVACKHWRVAPSCSGGGRCKLEVHGKHPSYGVCGVCEKATHLRGIGDLVHRITSWVGLVGVMERKSCKCSSRRLRWNRLTRGDIFALVLRAASFSNKRKTP